MVSRRTLVWLSVLHLAWPTLALCQPMTGDMMDGMGGGRHTSINLVSPADSPVQIARGMLTLFATSSPPSTPGAGSTMMGGMTAGSRLRLVLYGVADGKGKVSSTGNHLVLEGRLTSASAPSSAVSLDQAFDVVNGLALVTARISLPPTAGRATLLIENVSITDAGGAVLAQVGVQVTAPSPRPTTVASPTPVAGASCHQQSDCDDEDADTQDLCMSGRCMHMPAHGGPGMMH